MPQRVRALRTGGAIAGLLIALFVAHRIRRPRRPRPKWAVPIAGPRPARTGPRTRHRKSRDTYRATDAHWADVLNALTTQVAIIDRHGTIVHANDAWHAFAERARMYGDPLRVGADYVDAWRQVATEENDAARAVLERLQAVLRNGGGGGLWVEYPCLQAGRTFEIEIASLPLPTGGAVIAQRDDTARTSAEHEAQERRLDSAHTARVAAIGGLTASLAHELNQPLTAILTNAQTAQRHLATPLLRADEVRNILVDIVADVTRASDIIDRMRSLLKKGPIAAGDLDVNDIVRAVTKLLASDAVIRQATITCLLDPTVPLVRADGVQIQQVVLNLILNALEAMARNPESNGAERRVTVSTHTPDATHVTVRVSDTGPGLGPTPDRWFEAFQSNKAGGLGVGLSIARMIVEAHGGLLRAENNDAGGATFDVRLPAAVHAGVR